MKHFRLFKIFELFASHSHHYSKAGFLTITVHMNSLTIIIIYKELTLLDKKIKFNMYIIAKYQQNISETTIFIFLCSNWSNKKTISRTITHLWMDYLTAKHFVCHFVLLPLHPSAPSPPLPSSLPPGLVWFLAPVSLSQCRHTAMTQTN